MSAELDRILSIEESALNRNNEIDRILECNEQDFFAITEINPLTTPIDEIPTLITKIYRKKSLLIHPDKTDHPRASEAFDRLKKAQKILTSTDENESEFKEKQRLMSIYATFHSDGVPSSFDDPFHVRVRSKVDEIIENELAHSELERLAKVSEETRKNEMQKQMREEKESQRKMESEWEETRDSRVQNWRNYSNKIEKKGKKKKSKPKILA
ncbi:spf31 [Candida margitis]|uniref:spf31 n=1 Tax=Candida margitis TaxID=1775924 RepID=UPI0022280151|nr:spf31 [Candida margitis]KAI5967757.1 spf31 [Candida margitis]